MKIQFTAYGLAKPAGSKRAFAFVGKDNRPHARVVDACAAGKSWQHVVASAARDAYDGPLVSGAVTMTLVFYFPRPAGHSGKKGLKASAPAFHTKRPDALKLARGVEDALTGVAYVDDSQIVQEHLFKNYGEPARVEVLIQSLSPVRTMLARGMDRRRINELTGVSRSIISDIDHGRRKDYRDPNQIEPRAGKIARCPTCGGKVIMPCRACSIRAGRILVNENT